MTQIPPEHYFLDDKQESAVLCEIGITALEGLYERGFVVIPVEAIPALRSNEAHSYSNFCWCADSMAIAGLITRSRARELTDMTLEQQEKHIEQLAKEDPEWFGYLQRLNGQEVIIGVNNEQ